MRTEITSEIYVTVKNHYAGRTPPHMHPTSYDETVSRYVDALVAISEAIDAAGHDRVRAALERRDGPATRWGDCVRRCIAALVNGRVDNPACPLSTFPYVRAVDQMLGANRRDFEAAALKWIAGIGG